MKKYLVYLIMVLLAFMISNLSWAQTIVMIPNVPDANQPLVVVVGCTPFVKLPNYCAPISAANILEYWDTVVGHPNAIGVTGSPGLPARIIAEYVGWFMDTNNTGGPCRGNGPHNGTYTKDIDVGISEFVQWNSIPVPCPPHLCPPPPGKRGYNWTLLVDLDTGTNLGFPFYKAEINAGRPAVVNFYYWNPIPTGIVVPNPTGNIEVYDFGPPISSSRDADFPPDDFEEEWNPEEGIGHAVTGVGYIQHGLPWPEYAIVHDNWPNTPHDPTAKYMAIPWKNWKATISPDPDNSAGDITLKTPGPFTWSYILTAVKGAVTMWSYTGAGITGAKVGGSAGLAGWTVASQTATEVVFLASTRLTPADPPLSGFTISGPQPGTGSWICHANSGTVGGPLPVELSMFTASADSMKVTLDWRTETETNNLGFNIYRSDTRDGEYIKVNARLIAGAGSDATPHDYSFTDENVVKGFTYYYYIEDVDFTGKTNKSHIIEVTVGKQGIKTHLIPQTFALLQNYPNPFNPETWIPFKLVQDASVVIHIYSAKGQLVRTITLGNQKTGAYLTKDKAAYWDGRDGAGEQVASGVYFYNMQAGDFQATRRMVIVK
jgi:hypothetical protein